MQSITLLNGTVKTDKEGKSAVTAGAQRIHIVRRLTVEDVRAQNYPKETIVNPGESVELELGEIDEIVTVGFEGADEATGGA